MSIAYGNTNGVIPTQSSRLIGVHKEAPKPPRKKSPWGIFRILIVVTEVVAAIGVSVLTAGVAAPEAVGGVIATEAAVDAAVDGAFIAGEEALVEGVGEVATEGAIEGVAASETTEISSPTIPKIFSHTQGQVIQAGIALGGAATNTFIDAETGHLNSVNIGINFGAALLPGLSAITSRARNYFNVQKAIGKMAKGEIAEMYVTAARAQENAVSSERKLFADSLMSVADANTQKKVIDLSKDLHALGLNDNEMVELMRIVQQEDVSLIGGAGKVEASKLKDISRRMAQNTGIKQSIAELKFKKILELSDNLDKLKIKFSTTTQDLITQVHALTGETDEKLLRAMFLTGKPTKTIQRVLIGNELARIANKLSSDEVRTVYTHILHQALTGSQKNISKLWKTFMDSLGSADKALFKNTEESLNALLELTGTANRNVASRFVRYSGSAEFDARYVQTTQAIFDANDLGRAPVEFVYRKAMQRIRRRTAKKMMSNTGKFLSKTSHLEEALIKAGWQIIPSSYLMAIRILPGGTPMQRLAFVKFRPDTTAGKGINTAGKSDVLIRCSDVDVVRLVSEAGSYWWSNKGRKKGWWFSRGGRKYSGFRNKLSTGLSLFLGFLPTNAMRRWFSLTSNVIENAADMKSGEWTAQWLAKAERSFMRSLINRSARLATRGAINEGATKLMGKTKMTNLVGRSIERGVIGRELQRLSISTLQPLEGGKKGEFFRFNTSNYSNRLRKKMTLAGVTSVRSNLLRTKLAKGTYIKKTIGANRKFRIARRTPSSLTPNNIYKTRRFGKL